MVRKRPPPPANAVPGVDIKAFEQWTEKEQAFVRGFVLHGDRKRAILEAGYECSTPNMPYILAWEILNRPHVQVYLRQVEEEVKQRHAASVDRIVEELAAIAFANPAAFIKREENWTDDGRDVPEAERLTARQKREMGLPPDAVRMRISEEHASSRDFAAVQAIRETKDGVQLVFHSKIAALELLGKHQRMFIERVELDVSEDLAERLRRARDRSAKLIEGEATDVTDEEDPGEGG